MARDAAHHVPAPLDHAAETMVNERAREPRDAAGGAAALGKDVRQLVRSVAAIEGALRSAEARIEADAHRRILTLRAASKDQLVALYVRYRRAHRLIDRLANAKGIPCLDVERAARRAVTEARTFAEAMLEQLRRSVTDEDTSSPD